MAETFCHSTLCDFGKKHCFWKALRLGLFFLLKLAGRRRRIWRIGGMTLTGGKRTHSDKNSAKCHFLHHK